MCLINIDSYAPYMNHIVRMVKVLMALLMGLYFLLFCSGCEQRQEQGEISYPIETARMVSQVTSGSIASADPVRVRFVAPMVEQNVVGHSLQIPVFSFDPVIDGIAQWEDMRTLIFQPNGELPFRTQYQGTLDLAALFPQHKEEKLQPLRFQFEVAGREIASITADFKLHREDEPLFLIYEGVITFTETASLDEVKKAARLYMRDQRLELTWKAGDDGKQCTFTSEVIERAKTEKEFTLQVNKKPLDLSHDYEKKFVLTPLEEMKVLAISKQEEGAQPRIEIECSDDLDARQDIRGLIAVEPALDIQLKVVGKRIVVEGNFRHGERYTLKVNPGVRSRWAAKTNKVYAESIEFGDLKPQIRFANDGVFLPSVNQQKIAFMTLNLSKVRLQIKKVFESNMGQFLQTERLDSAKDRRDQFGEFYVNRVGVEIVKKELEIGKSRNVWLQHELDLRELIQPGEKGLFLISMRFLREDMLYGSAEEAEEARRTNQYYYGDDYYSHPYSPGYIHTHGHVYKPIILSDIGLTYYGGHQRHLVYATHINDTRPLSKVTVTLRTYQNQVIAQQKTDGDGKADFQGIEQAVFYVEAEKDGQRSVIKPNEMAWNLSTFDTGGEVPAPDGTRAYIYTERGVYRPGDEINMSVIARNEDHTFPDNHPVTLKIYNPRNQLAFEQTKKDGRDGFYTFTFQTGPDDPTGNWRAQIVVGSRTFHHTLKIETVVPYRLKVNIEPEKPQLACDDTMLRLDLISTYLFGSPAADLNAEVDVALRHAPKRFPAYAKFSFTNETVEYKAVNTTIFKGKLNAQGKAHVKWRLPSFAKAPSAINATITAKVLEKGGRPNQNTMNIPINTYPCYVGIERPLFDYGYARVGTRLPVPVIAVDPQGTPMPGRSLTYRIYRNTTYWWWEYDNRNQFRLRFKSHHNTELIKEGMLVSASTPVHLDLTPDDRGEYLIEVQDGDETGHAASFFMRAYAWGGAPAGGKDAGVLTLKSDKKKYNPGDEAVVSFPVPKQGRVLASIESGAHILDSRWYQLGGDQEEMKIKIPVTADMVPTAYVAVSVIQSHQQTLNDRPLRMYGVIPVHVEDASTRQEVLIHMPETLKSKEPFTVKIETSDKRPTQFTIAVVDEGLLALTQFETPDPWKAFFKKLCLGVRICDLFSYVIGANKGDVFKTFSVGGGVMAEYRASQLKPERKKRFKPVSMFKGPIMTDDNGRAAVSFAMPNYIGAVRVMVVAAHGKQYGHAEKTVPVRTDLMVLSTLPRVLGPEDKIVVPVTVFAMKEKLGPVEVSLETEGPLSVQGKGTKTIKFAAAGEQDVEFAVHVDAAVGQARITVTASSDDMTSTQETDIEVRPSSPRIYDSEHMEIMPGTDVSCVVPNIGILGSNHARISVRRRPNLNFAHRLRWLIHYPYGCIEQTVSSVFPQLYLKDFLKESKKGISAEKEIDMNINAGIRRLRKFQLPSGAFTYWPGNRKPSVWGTNYAGHFLIEARKLGYHVPGDMFAQWLRYQKSQALITRDNLMVRVYRVYLLALAESHHIGAMNLLKENNLKDMNDTQKWLLSAAYRLAGVDRTADHIMRGAGKAVNDYFEFGGTYGSGMRDKAMILDMLVVFERWHEADILAEELAEVLSTRDWYSTQTTGFMLLALGKYLRALEGSTEQTPLIAGTITLPDGEKVKFETESIGYQLDIESGFGKKLKVHLDKKSTVKRAFVILDWDGVPLKSDVQDESRNLVLRMEWLDENGMPIDPTELTHGCTFWGRFQVGKSGYSHHIEELALVQVLPAGWEIENIRLSGEALPGWMSRWKLNQEEYLDIRDDRIMWFFDLMRHQKYLDFVVKVNAVTVGEFTLPPTLLEAMYNNNYKATRAGKEVKVKKK